MPTLQQLSVLAYNGRFSINDKDVWIKDCGQLILNQPVKGTLTIGTGIKTLTVPNNLERQLASVEKSLTFEKVEQGSTGVWIPYRANTNVYGFLEQGHTWAASGPYSGCIFEVGYCGNRFYAAHLSREGGSQPHIKAWDNFNDLNQKVVLFSQKIGVYQPNTDLRAYKKGTPVITVASINQNQRTVSVTRLNVLSAEGLGSQSGRIMAVAGIPA